MKLKSTIATLAFLAGTLLAGAANADNYEIDVQHSWITFKIKHGIYAVSHGQLSGVTGAIVFDKADPAKSSVKAEIDLNSLHTGFEQRDADLKGPDFFNAAEFPTVSFESSKIEKVDDKTGKVTGNLTIGGVAREIVLDVTLVNEAPAPWDANLVKAAFSATGTVSTADFPMAKAAAGFGLGPEVQVAIDIEATKK